jgi:hypothetical protein
MSKILNSIFTYFLIIILSLIIIGFMFCFALWCAGNADFVMGFIMGIVIYNIFIYFIDK